MTFKYNEPEEKTINIEPGTEPVPEPETETAESDQPMLDDAQIRAAALAYARFLKDNDLTPDGESAEDPGETAEVSEEAAEVVEEAAEEAEEAVEEAEAPAEEVEEVSLESLFAGLGSEPIEDVPAPEAADPDASELNLDELDFDDLDVKLTEISDLADAVKSDIPVPQTEVAEPTEEISFEGLEELFKEE